jgi:Lrp/AsnC family leucine-responsive transcriptional regulator
MKSKPTKPLDALDWRILEELQSNARLTLSELGQRIGLSQPAVSERLKRLESRGVIQGYSARINYQAVGLDLLAIVRIKTTFEELQSCLKLFASMPEVLEVHRVTGEDCLILKVIVPQAARLASVIDRLAKYGSVSTSIVLSSTPPRAHHSQSARRGWRGRTPDRPACARFYTLALGALLLLVARLFGLITITARLTRLLAATADGAMLTFTIIVLCLLGSLTTLFRDTLTLTTLILTAVLLVRHKLTLIILRST